MVVGLSQDHYGYGSLHVIVSPTSDIDEYDLALFVDGSEYCNTSHMDGDNGGYEMSCVF